MLVLLALLAASIEGQVTGIARTNKSNIFTAPQVFKEGMIIEGPCTGCGTSVGGDTLTIQGTILALNTTSNGETSEFNLNTLFTHTGSAKNFYSANYQTRAAGTAVNSSFYGLRSVAQTEPGKTGATYLYGINGVAENLSTGTNASGLYGVYGQAFNLASSTVSSEIALAGVVGTSGSGVGTVTSATGLYLAAQAITSGTITNAYGVQLAAPYEFSAGSITNWAGFASAAPTAATNNTEVLLGTTTVPAGNYSIYSSSAQPSVFTGPLRLGAGSTSATSVQVGGITTGLYSTGADTMAIAANGTANINFTSIENVLYKDLGAGTGSIDLGGAGTAPFRTGRFSTSIVSPLLTRTTPASTTGATQAGLPISITASNAVASTDTASAAGGGSITYTSGAASRFSSGNADGGDHIFVVGSGIGTGRKGKVLIPNHGSTTVPSLAFVGDTTTGLGTQFAGSFDLIANGLSVVEVASNAVYMNKYIAAGADGTLDIGSTASKFRTGYFGTSIVNALGSASAPSYTFTGDPNTGIYSSGGDTLNFAVAGFSGITLNSAQISFGVHSAGGGGSANQYGWNYYVNNRTTDATEAVGLTQAFITNAGATSLVTRTLPTVSAGLNYKFYVADTDGLKLVASTGDDIRLGDNITSTAGYIQSLKVGNFVELVGIDGDHWVAIGGEGTWTNGTWSYTFNTAKAVETATAINYSTQYVSASVADSFNASQTIDWASGNVHSISLTGSITSSTWSNPVAGGRYAIALTQGGTGSYTVAWPASVKWSGGVAPTLTTTVGKTDIFSCLYVGTNYYCGAALNF